MISHLEELCGIQIAIVLANKLELKNEILRLPDLESESWLKNMEEKVLDTLKKFPFVLREKIPTSVVIFCLSQSIKWAKFHNKEFELPYEYSCHFLTSSFFTSKGLINNEKAAREILKDTEISSPIRFGIACYYCFSDVIPALWEQLPEDKKPKVENGVYQNGLGTIGNHKMVILWSQFLLGELQITMDDEKSLSLTKLRKSFESDFHVSFENCNDVSFRSCFEELNMFERKEVLILCRKELENILIHTEDFDPFIYNLPTCLFPHQLNLPFHPYIELVIFLLCSLDEMQLKVFFQPHILYFVLFHLLFWPYQHLFLSTVNRFSDILPKFEFCMLLENIVSMAKNKSSCKLCDYHNILRDFWMQSPSSSKKFFFHIEGRPMDDFLETLPLEEQNEHFKFYSRSHFEELFGWSVICDLFRSSFTIEDENILRLIFESATLEEKSDIVRIQGNKIGRIAFQTCDLRRVDLFIELCVPKEGIESFKKELFNEETLLLWHLVLDSKLKEVQNILNWVSCAEDIKELWLTLLLIYVSPLHFLSFSSNDLKCIDKFLEWNFSSDEIKDFKESLVSDTEDFVKLLFHFLFNEKYFQQMDIFLKWSFSSEIKFLKFKKGLAFGIIPHIDSSLLISGVGPLKNFIKWCALSENECNDFKSQLAFSEGVIKSYNEFASHKQLHIIDELIQWAELAESEVKHFKTLCLKNKEM